MRDKRDLPTNELCGEFRWRGTTKKSRRFPWAGHPPMRCKSVAGKRLSVRPRVTPTGQRTHRTEDTLVDYGMTDGRVTVPIRHALLDYFNKRLRLDFGAHLDDPPERPVIVANRDVFGRALADAAV